MRKGMENYHKLNMGIIQFNTNTLEKLKALRYETVSTRKVVLSTVGYTVLIRILYHSTCVFHTIGKFGFSK